MVFRKASFVRFFNPPLRPTAHIVPGRLGATWGSGMKSEPFLATTQPSRRGRYLRKTIVLTSLRLVQEAIRL